MIENSDQWFDLFIPQRSQMFPEKVRENLARFAGRRDLRQSGGGIVRGFGAIHYAAFYNAYQLFQIVLSEEFASVTADNVSVSYPERYFQFELPAMSTFVHVLAVSRASEAVLNVFLTHLLDDRLITKYYNVIGVQNALGQSATHVALLANSIAPWCQLEHVLRVEVHQRAADGLTILEIAHKYGRVAFLEALERHVSQQARIEQESARVKLGDFYRTEGAPVKESALLRRLCAAHLGQRAVAFDSLRADEAVCGRLVQTGHNQQKCEEIIRRIAQHETESLG